MELSLNLVAPIGEATRREIQAVLDILKADNELWISGMQASGHRPPCCARSVPGFLYRPPVGREKQTPRQEFYAAPFMFTRGHGSCCDICAYDAAAKTVLFGVPTRVLAVPQGPTSYHITIATPRGPVDPLKNWDRRRCTCPVLN
jgi:hypothetical protein